MTAGPVESGGIRAGVRRLFRLALRTPELARRDADDELDGFVGARIEHLVARGMSPDDARTEALSRLGSTIDEARERVHRSAEHRENRMRLTESFADITQDLRYAVRGLVARPGFTCAVVLTLALGIGAATGVFSIVNGVLLRALPYADPDRLVRLFETAPPAQGSELRSIAIPTLSDWRNDLRQFDGIALYGPQSFDISGGDRPDQVEGATASAALFSVLGAKPVYGRTFSPDEERPGAPLVALLSYRLWQRRFGGDSSIVGRTIRLNRQAFNVIGVMPRGFAYPANAELWASLAIDGEYEARAARHLSAVARLKPNVSFASATAELLAEEHRLAKTYPENYGERGVRIIPLEERIVGSVRPVLSLLAGAVLLLLLVACVNVANLLVARATSRRREIALRIALGAGRMRVARQLLVEAMVLFVTAGAVGLAVAALIVQGVHAMAADVLPRTDAIQLDGPVMFFALAVTALTGVAFGLVPAVRSSAAEPAASLLDGGRGSTSGRSAGGLRSVLIVTETALAAMLLIGAGLLARSMDRLSHVDPGLEIGHVLTFGVSLPDDKAADPTAVVAFFRDLRERIATIPGVRGVGLASRLPLSGADHSNGFLLEREVRGEAPEHSAQDRSVSPGFFGALGIRVLRGREFTDADAVNAPPVIVVNDAFAKRYFPGENAVGRRIVPSRAGGMSREIVGVVADTRQFGLDVPAEPEFYIPHAQDPWSFLAVAVRTQGDALRMLSPVQEAIWSLDRELPLGNVRTMEQMTAEGGAQRRLITVVLTLFATAAYLLAAIGLYGVIAFAVAQRTAEIGIRLALGARRSQIARMVVLRGVRLAAFGAIAGLVAAVPLTRWLRGLLFGVTETDPMTFLAVMVLVPAVAVVASLVPARRAVRIDPARAMRAE